MTGRDLVSASLRLIGALAPGETPAASEATDGLASLNRMIDSWSNESLMIHERKAETFQLSVGVGAYSMGPGATFNTIRPMDFEEATIKDDSQTPAIEFGLRVVAQPEWSTVIAKSVQTSVPSFIYPEGTYPNETLNLWPVPNAAHKLVLYTRKPLTTIASLSTEVSLPPGYEEALVYNLAVRLAPEYGRPLSAENAEIARESKASVKRNNQRPRLLKVDEALRQPRRYNIYTGDSA